MSKMKHEKMVDAQAYEQYFTNFSRNIEIIRHYFIKEMPKSFRRF